MSKNFLKCILLLGDIAVTQIALFLTLLLRNKSLLGQFQYISYNFLFLYIIWIFILFVLNLYDLYFFQKPTDFFLHVIIFSLVAIFAGISYFYFRPEFGITPKTVLVLDVIVFSLLFLAWRWVFSIFLHTKGIKEKIVIIGFQEDLKNTMAQLDQRYDVSAIFYPSLPDDKNKYHVLSDNTRIVYILDDLRKIVAEKKVTSVIFALDFYTNKDLVEDIFYHLPLTLNYIDHNDVYEFIHKKVLLHGLNEVWFLEKVSKSENKWEKILKRFFDIIIGVVGLLLFFVLFPVIALLIATDSSGHVFYTQKRVGKNGKVFIIYKFRTMKETESQNKEVWRENDNNNITHVGTVLRRLHLDELPQSWSMVKGDISFVGPRPEWTELAKTFEKEIPFYKQRYLVKPGIIGWAQINFPASRSLEEVKEKFQYDLYYIKNRSLLLDFEIILKAIKLFFW